MTILYCTTNYLVSVIFDGAAAMLLLPRQQGLEEKERLSDLGNFAVSSRFWPCQPVKLSLPSLLHMFRILRQGLEEKERLSDLGNFAVSSRFWLCQPVKPSSLTLPSSLPLRPSLLPSLLRLLLLSSNNTWLIQILVLLPFSLMQKLRPQPLQPQLLHQEKVQQSKHLNQRLSF